MGRRWAEGDPSPLCINPCPLLLNGHCFSVLKSANTSYSAKVDDNSTREQTLLDLAWKVDDLSRLSTTSRNALVEISSLKELFEDANTNMIVRNIGRRLSLLRVLLTTFVKGK